MLSKVKGKRGFPTGVSLVDINSDGLLDIYICKSGDYDDLDYRRNELYINQGNNDEGIPLFNEEASKYNLDLPHYSTQATFFDYDRDGDLDMFLINHGIDPGYVEPNIPKLLKNLVCHQWTEFQLIHHPGFPAEVLSLHTGTLI